MRLKEKKPNPAWIFAAALLYTLIPVKGYAKIHVGPDVVLGYTSPVGSNSFGSDMKSAFSPRFGLTARKQGLPMEFTLATGYERYKSKENTETSFTVIPVVFSGRFYFGRGKVQPFAGATLGLAFETLKFKGSRQSNTDGVYGVSAGGAFRIARLTLRAEAFYDMLTSFAKNYKGDIDIGQSAGLRMSAVYFFNVRK